MRNIDVVLDDSNGGSGELGESYFCTLQGFDEQNRVTKKGLITRDLTVNVYRVRDGTSVRQSSAWSLETGGDLKDSKQLNLPHTDSAYLTPHPKRDIASVKVVAVVANVVVAVDYGDSSSTQAAVGKEAVALAKMYVGRLVD